VIAAIGMFSVITLALGMTLSVDGAMPRGHCNIAPLTTGIDMT
jgi:hypothetical protein